MWYFFILFSLNKTEGYCLEMSQKTWLNQQCSGHLFDQKLHNSKSFHVRVSIACSGLKNESFEIQLIITLVRFTKSLNICGFSFNVQKKNYGYDIVIDLEFKMRPSEVLQSFA